MPLAPELKAHFVGRAAHFEVHGVYGRYVPPPGKDDGRPWPDLSPDEHAGVHARLLRLGVGRQAWSQAPPEVHALLVRVCDALEHEEEAIQAVLGVTPWGMNQKLAKKATKELLEPFIEWSDAAQSTRQSFQKASDRLLRHWLARMALKTLTRVLHAAKQAAKAKSLFTSRDWQNRTAAAADEVISSFMLGGDCGTTPLRDLEKMEPRKLAVRILADVTGLAASDFDRSAPRLRAGPKE
jgi:hypothetical protein